MLSFEDRVKLLFVPPPFYYAHKVAKEARRGEPELDHMAASAPKGRRAIDIGANRGIYS